jgi:exopolysaccharide production protein ExoQ
MPSPPDDKPVGAASLALASTAALALFLPVAMALANRSSPVTLGIASALGVAALAASGQVGSLVAKAAIALRHPAMIALGALIALSLVTLAFVHPASGGRALAAPTWLMVALALGAIPIFSMTRDARLTALLTSGIGACLLIVLIDLQTDMALRRLFGGRSFDYVHNRPLVVAQLLLWPGLAGLLLAGTVRGKAMAVLLAAATAFVASQSASGAAVLGLVAGFLAFAAARIAPRATLGAGLILTLAALALAPVTGKILSSLADERALRALSGAHAAERIAIWQAYGEAALAAPWLSWGFGGSNALALAPGAEALAARHGNILMDTHPHHAFLQVWVELGLAGVILAAALLSFVFRFVHRLDAGRQPFAIAALAAALAVGLVSHGLWQAWWIAALGACAAAFAALPRETAD